MIAFALGFMMILSSSYANQPAPPVAAKKTHRLTKHGDVRIDPYFWLKERENPEVIKYLVSENKYTEAVLKPVKTLQEELFQEMKGRIKQDDTSAPEKDGNYFYYTRTETNKEYPIFCRKTGSIDAKEEILINVNDLAKGHDYFHVAGVQPSPDHSILAYAVDNVGRRFYTIFFKDLKTGKILSDRIENVTPSFAWAADNKTVFYAKQHPETLRSEKVFRHELGLGAADELVFEERDETFSVYVLGARTDQYIFIHSDSTLATEVQYLKSDNPKGALTLFQARQKNHEYEVMDGGDRFYVLTNLRGAKNFTLMETPYQKTAKQHWKTVVPHRKDVFIENVEVLRSHIAIEARSNGLTQIEILNRKTGTKKAVKFKDPAYVVSVGGNREFDTGFLRFNYQSMTTPPSTIDYDLKTGKQFIRKTKEVLGGFKSENYESKRIMARAKDGTRVPVSVLYRKDKKKAAVKPLLIYGYGSYGHSVDPAFSSNILSLVDRGFTYAIAHIRGGSEMGRPWYENGRQLKKMNTFTDFISATEGLIKEKLATPGHIFAMGGSAGGLLMGAVANMRPDLYRGIVAQVPFVDVITTMLDDSIPLTTGEYDEWGNPNIKKYYNYIKRYSPYDNVKPQAYPAMFILTGFHDSQVQYWEPAKWIAKLRTVNTSSNPLLMKTEMKAGHGGKSGRFEHLREFAEELAFILLIENQN